MTDIDPRLAAAGELVRPGVIAADIGTDHGYLICHLVASGKIPRGFACDINPGPLASAKKHIDEAGLTSKITAILSDGLSGLSENDADDILILGMGGDLIGKILLASPWTRDPQKRFILQPMTKAEKLRTTLLANGFEIQKEVAVESGRFVYTVMLAEYTGKIVQVDELFAWTGRLWYNDNIISRKYLAMVGHRLQKKADGLAKSGDALDLADYYQRLADKIMERAGQV